MVLDILETQKATKKEMKTTPVTLNLQEISIYHCQLHYSPCNIVSLSYNTYTVHVHVYFLNGIKLLFH